MSSDDPRQLAHFLFRTKGLHGEREDYYSPLNGSLAHTIIEKRGLPISLCSIFILVGARLGMDIQGINLPGHFITQAKVGETTVLVDCFNDGQVIEEKHITEYAPPHVLQSLVADADTVIQRALKNLVNSYEMIDDIKRQMLMRELLGACEAEDKLFF
jgi:regulator of sirC expression with transglutaminase-like and TPR domain